MSSLTAQPYRVPIAYVRVDEQPTPHGIPCYASTEWFQFLSKEVPERLGGIDGMTIQEIQVAIDALEATTALHTTQISVHTGQIAGLEADVVGINLTLNDIYNSIASITQFNPGYLEQQLNDLYATVAALPAFNPHYLEQRIHDNEVLGADV
jgi:hypothetical protein